MTRRIGVIYPSDGTGNTEFLGLEAWLRSHGLDDIAVDTVCSASDGRHECSSLERTGALAVLTEAASALKGRGCSAVVWACTSGSFIAGPAGAHKQISAITGVLGVPATSTSLALARAACSLNLMPIEILSPYPAEIGGRFIAFLAEFGIPVSAASDLDSATGEESRRLDIAAEIARHEARHGQTGRPLLIPDTAIDTLDQVAGLEEAFGRVVITANQASVWDVLRLAGVNAALADGGLLLRSPSSQSCSW